MPLEHSYWTHPSHSFPEHPEYMEIIPDRGVILCPLVMTADPLKHVPLTVSYVEAEDGSIRTRARPEFPWNADRYRMEGDVIFWNHREGAEWWPWRRITVEEMPEWYGTFREKALAKFEERERVAREQGVKGAGLKTSAPSGRSSDGTFC